MSSLKIARSLRIRYIIGLTMIALLVTASYTMMQRIVSEQRNFATMVNLAGHQSGLSNRIAYFAGLMATTDDDDEFDMAKAQVGRTINKMERAHAILRQGDAELGIPRLTNDNLDLIFEDPMVGLDNAVERYFERARNLYNQPMDQLSTSSVAYIFLITYGPHVLEPMFDSVVDEYERIGREAILRIERMEFIIWLSTLVVLALEVVLIFLPLERRLRDVLATLQSERNFLQHVIDGVNDPIVVVDRDHAVLRMNRAVHEIAGQYNDAPEKLLACRRDAQDRHAVCACDEARCLLQEVIDMGSPRKIVRTLMARNGEQHTLEVSMSPLLDDTGEVMGAIEAYRDITGHLALMDELKASQLNYAHLAQHDALTGLPNRMLFNDRLGQSMHMAHREDAKLAVLFIDLDGFKLVNDSYDHSFGDEVLKLVALRIKGLMREDDTVARMGGDEFTVILRNVSHSEDAGLVAEKVLASFREPFEIRGRTVFLGASIGISVYPKHGSTIDDLVRKADTAMYRAKDEGRNTFRYYSKGMTVKAFRRITLDTQLRRALNEHQFALHYQPQFDLADNTVSGIEALVRWYHPENGIVSPAKFIPAAEESGLIIGLGSWILEESCRQMKTWLDDGLLAKDALMCVNISAKQFDQEDFTGLISQTLEKTGLAATNLELEITESTMMRSADLTGQVLKELRKLGVKVAIDDFGTGYSSLSHLKLLPLTKLKIDKSFVSDIPSDPNDMAITRAVILLGKSLSLEILAEGVETEEQLAFLHDEGCNNGQGYLFCKPMPAPELETYLRSSDEGSIGPARAGSV